MVQSTARLFYALKSPENGLVSNLSKNALKITAALSKIMVGALKIAGGVWEKSKNYRYPSGVALIVNSKLYLITDLVIGRPEIADIRGARPSAKEMRKNEKNNIDLQRLLQYCVREHIKSAERIKRGCKKWVFATRLENSELSPKV